MFSIYRLFKPVGAVRFLVGVAALLVLAAPALAQTFVAGDFVRTPRVVGVPCLTEITQARSCIITFLQCSVVS